MRQPCSGTDDPWSHSKVMLRTELSLWLEDQRQRTAQQANVNCKVRLIYSERFNIKCGLLPETKYGLFMPEGESCT